MKCPYCCNHQTIQQTTYEYNEDGVITAQTLVESQNLKLHDCLKEECAAWQNGKCAYVGAVN